VSVNILMIIVVATKVGL